MAAKTPDPVDKAIAVLSKGGLVIVSVSNLRNKNLERPRRQTSTNFIPSSLRTLSELQLQIYASMPTLCRDDELPQLTHTVRRGCSPAYVSAALSSGAAWMPADLDLPATLHRRHHAMLWL